MNPLFNYVIQVIIISGLLYSYYHWVLRNKKFHRYNRYYLLGAAVLSILIPLLNIPVYFTEEEAASSIVYSTLTVFAGGNTEDAVLVYTNTAGKTSWFTWNHILQLFYVLVATVVLLRIIFSLLKIRRIVRRHTVEQISNIRFMNTDEPGTPYSFFRWLFWNRKIDLNSEKGEQIFRHELFHIEQKHSLDILFFELLTVVGWFNPFFHLMKRETKAIHEFLADQFAITENNRWDYAELLLMQVLNTNQKLVHPFFHNQIKRRIAMITSPQKTSHQYLRKLMVLPVTAIAVMLFAFSYKSNHSSIANAAALKQKLILIDIGHGGSDHGAIGPDGTTEKDLALSIAQHIREFNKNLGFNIEFTRTEDMLPDLKTRIKARGEQPSLFLSLHINSSLDNNRKGIEVYVPNEGHPFSRESQQLGAALLNQLQTFYTIENKLLQRSKSVWVLEHSNCPAALLEVGYISNNNDLQFFSKSENQELVAKKILAAISTYLNQDNDKSNSINTIADTIGKPELIIKKEVQQLSSGTVILSDSIIYKSDGQRKADPAFKPILILNGKRIFESSLKDKVIIADKVISYSAGDKEALKVYGTAARNGVLVFFNAKITDAEIKDAKPEADKIFDKVEIEASYPGGIDAWRKYLMKSLHAEVPIKQKAPAGTYTVFIQFIVKLDGTVSDIRALTSHGFGMEAEAIRVIENGGKWLPAIQNGRQVVAYRKQPITFVVNNGLKKEGNKPDEVVITENNEQNSGSNEKATLLFEKVESEAEFPGGITKWREYLQRNCRSNVATDSGAPAGKYTVLVQFIVNKEGEVSNIIPLTRHGYGMEEEVVRIIKEGPKWKPAEQNGKPVIAYKKQPVTFVVSEDDNEPKENTNGSVREIMRHQFNAMSVTDLLGVAPSAEIRSFSITIEKENGVTMLLKNTGNQFNTGIKDILDKTGSGKMIIFENILIKENGQEKKSSARAYKILL